MDLVVPVRQEAAGTHPELRYALRSFEHNVSGVEEVWILGGKPRWGSGLNHVPLVQAGIKYQNVRRMLKHACLEPAISDPFLLSNDDIFWLQPQELGAMKMLHGGDFCTFIRNQQTRVGNSRYVQGACQSIKLLERHGYTRTLSWSLHVPLVVHKEAFLEAISWCGDSGVPYHLRSIYGNIAGLTGDQHRDVKLVGNETPDPLWLYTSTSDVSWQTRKIGRWLRDRFQEPSRWES